MLKHMFDPAAVPIDPRTGEPRRPGAVVAAAILMFVGVGAVMAGLLWAMWLSVDRFEQAAWLNRAIPTEFGDPVRAAVAAGLVAIGLVIATTSSMTAWYASQGYGWTRWAGVVSSALAFGALAINVVSIVGIPLIVVGSALLWTPPARRFADAWNARRHPVLPPPEIVDEVYYGPLPRYLASE